jgi:hypothetical protein
MPHDEPRAANRRGVTPRRRISLPQGKTTAHALEDQSWRIKCLSPTATVAPAFTDIKPDLLIHEGRQTGNIMFAALTLFSPLPVMLTRGDKPVLPVKAGKTE